ncbi:hypothetical protein [Candidatus Ichthyocystis sparus]|uniref:hypothetical protein n=1 Tax=Candidatus Ichthyocystis sparus TaxID=1561004 RepID=UPI00159EDB2A|nr:hypothetical protein [Candidatus Ichthyocystis sparus]
MIVMQEEKVARVTLKDGARSMERSNRALVSEMYAEKMEETRMQSVKIVVGLVEER